MDTRTIWQKRYDRKSPEQHARDRACLKRYLESRPFIFCKDCQTWQKQYGIKPLCRSCDQIRVRTGAKRTRPKYQQRPWIFCVVCLTKFRRSVPSMKTCSRACGNALVRLRSYRGRHVACQRCGRVRLIRAKKFCASCYVMTRTEMNKAGIYGVCGVRTNRFKSVPGVLRGA